MPAAVVPPWRRCGPVIALLMVMPIEALALVTGGWSAGSRWTCVSEVMVMSGDAEKVSRVRLAREEKYRFRVRFGDRADSALWTDESPPVGAGAGPDPSQLLAAAVGNCLASSLLFCTQKAGLDVRDLEVEVATTTRRDSGGRLRISDIRARLVPTVEIGVWRRMNRCLELFESFCTVTESVRQGIPVGVEIEPREPGHKAPVTREGSPVLTKSST
jgi:organic hydroperoxide reductase OsmC/OhrA